MNRYFRVFNRLSVACVMVTGLALATPTWAQEADATEEQAPKWTHRAELSYVSTGGNAEASTLGLRTTSTGTAGAGTVTLEAGALRAETTTTSRFAAGTAGSFNVREDSVTDVTAENYFFRGRYDRPISERLFWFAGAGWERNEFAGIKNRTQIVGGVGHLWYDNEEGHFRTDYGVTYTDQENVVGPPASDTFAGLRLGWDYLRPFGANTSYGNVLLVDINADETSDYRVDMINWLDVSMSERMALKISLQFLFDNEPSLGLVPLFTAGGPTDAVVLAPLDDLDTLFTVALAIDF